MPIESAYTISYSMTIVMSAQSVTDYALILVEVCITLTLTFSMNGKDKHAYSNRKAIYDFLRIGIK